jgi:protein-S-isoprenylcysteine O-methyltransferase Ste14
MPARVANILFLAGFVTYCAIRAVFQKRTKGNEKIDRRRDRTETILLFVVFLGNMLLPVIYILTPSLRFADYRLPGWMPWCGVSVMMLALWLFWRSHADLGRNWSITLEIRRDHELIRHGVYRFMRHPMYASIFLFGLAQGLMLSNWLAGWAAVATFTPMYFIRTPREERMMLEHFGDGYRQYMIETGRLWPRIWAKRDLRKSEEVAR